MSVLLRRCSFVPVLLSALALLVAAPVAAQAAITINQNVSEVFTVAGGSGADILFISTPGGNVVRFQDPVNDIVIDASATTCVYGGTNKIVNCNYATVLPTPVDTVNTLMGGGADTINGGSGNGDITVRHDGEEGADTYIPSADSMGQDIYNDSGTLTPTEIDMIDYSSTSDRVKVTLFDTAANDGRDCIGLEFATCEEDNVWFTVDEVRGGSGDDDINAAAGNNNLYGNGGHDVLNGQSGDDRLFGGSGSDTLIGGTQNDLLFADDGIADTAINCGDGTDVVEVDALDPPTDGCETIAGPPTNTVRPVPPTGTTNVGSMITSTLGVWTGSPTAYSYDWHRCTTTALMSCSDFAGGNDLTYQLTSEDAGTYMTLCVRATNAAGTSGPACSDLTALVTNTTAPSGGSISVTGSNYVGQDMTVKATFGGGAADISYTWFACDPLGGNCQQVLTGASIKSIEATLGRKLKVVATAKNIAGSASVERIGGIVGRTPSANCAGLDPKADTDADGLTNFVECNVVRYPTSAEYMDLPSLGADPKHRDIFLEIDKMKGYSISAAAVKDVMEAFDKAPLTNPDGKPGIRMHIDNGEFTPISLGSSTTWGRLSRSSHSVALQEVLGTRVGAEYDWSGVDEIKKTNFDTIRAFGFHYAIVAMRYGKTDEKSSGIARAGNFSRDDLGQDIIITVGAACDPLGTICVGSDKQQAGTIMHELGHNLGLGHGGRNGDTPDHANRKPNYPSIMSYNWQMTGLVKNGQTEGTLDYSRYGASSFATIDENRMNDTVAGVTAKGAAKDFKVMWTCIEFGFRIYPTTAPGKKIDWNCNFKSEKSVKVNVNNDFSTAGGAFLGKLEPREDWSQLVFTGGAIGGAGAASAEDGTIVIDNVAPPAQRDRTPLLEDKKSLAELVKSAASASGDRKPPKLAVKVGKRAKNGSVKVTITAIDARTVSEIVTRIDKSASTSVKPGKKAKKATITITVPKGKHSLTILAFDGIGNQAKLVRKFK